MCTSTKEVTDEGILQDRVEEEVRVNLSRDHVIRIMYISPSRSVINSVSRSNLVGYNSISSFILFSLKCNYRSPLVCQINLSVRNTCTEFRRDEIRSFASLILISSTISNATRKSK